MKFETLYRTDPRGKSFDELSATEYYQPRIDCERRGKGEVFFVRETHGYFDDQQKKMKNQTQTFNPDEPFESREEAEKWYENQLRVRAASGFVHVFAWDPMSPNGMSYQLLS
jgi:hypothetical protein